MLPRASCARAGNTFYSFKDLALSPDGKRVAGTVLAGVDGEIGGGNDFYRCDTDSEYIS